jgi:hypothetical protein
MHTVLHSYYYITIIIIYYLLFLFYYSSILRATGRGVGRHLRKHDSDTMTRPRLMLRESFYLR